MAIIDQFEAISEDGRIYTIIVNESVIDVSTHDDPKSSILGMKTAMTSEGYHVNNRGNNKFEIVETGDIVQRVK